MAIDNDDRHKIMMFPTITTLTEVATGIGLTFFEGADRILIPWELHRQFITFTAHPRPALVSIAQLRCEIAMSEMNAVMTYIEKWNSERINPTAAMRITDEGDISISLSCFYLIGAGATYEQLVDFVYRSSDVSEMAITELVEQLGDSVFQLDDFARKYEDSKAMRAPLFRPHNLDGDPQQRMEEETSLNLFLDEDEPALFDDPLTEVTVERIANAWAQRGIEHVEAHEDFIVTGINNILMAVFIDNGPSILMRGHWDCSLDEDDQLKAFLIANDWNNAPSATRALWVEEDHQLQLRVETAFPTTHGLSDDQLNELVSEATHAILKAIDTLSVEICGSSPVSWPDQ